jgi:hypothetical protein
MNSIASIFPASDVPAETRHHEDVRMRFDDFCQDSRVQLVSVVQAAQPVVWGHLGSHPGLRALWGQGIIPVLSRLVIEAHPGAFAPLQPFTVSLAHEFAHAQNGSGEVDRLMILVWGELSGRRGSLLAPSSPESELARCGRFFAEVVFTRLFAPAAERKITRFDAPGVPALPERCHPPRATDALLALPDGADALEPELAAEPAAIVFGLCHTDGNQHVSSFAYPRLFEEAALRRLAALGVTAPGLAREVELAYRKPFVAGEEARLLLRTFKLGERYGAVGIIIRDRDVSLGGDAKPHCYLRLFFER